MAKKKIYQYSFLYYILSRIAFLFLRIYYRKISIRGQDNVPSGMPVIFAPNHKNALMDTLLILYAFPEDQIVFMAVSYIFGKNKKIAGFLRFLKILPVYRAREGVNNLGKNGQSFTEAVETLQHNKKLCLMPEGQQLEKRKLLPLVKGMFRIGMTAQEKYSNREGVKIIPVGIEYDDLLHSGYNVTIQFGQPLELSDYFELYTINQAQAYNKIRADLYPEISKLMLNINSEKHYESIYLATILQVDSYINKYKLPDNAWSRLKAKQEISAEYLRKENSHPESLKELDKKMNYLLESGKSDDEIYRLLKKVTRKDILKMILFLPVFIPGAISMVPPYSLIKVLTGKFKDSGFYSTISFVAGIIIPFFFFLLYFLTSLFILPAFWSIIIFLLIIPVISIIAFRLKNLYFETFERIYFQRKYFYPDMNL